VKDRIYFDSCIYIAHYRQETDTYGQPIINSIGRLMSQNEKGGSIIITSSITICEVITKLLESSLKAQIEDFKNKFKRGLHLLYDADPEICEKAALYRAHYWSNPIKHPIQPPGNQPDVKVRNLTTMDSIQLATATTYPCGEFWTVDGLAKTNDKYKSIKLLWLGNSVVKDQLIITPPYDGNPAQPTLL